MFESLVKLQNNDTIEIAISQALFSFIYKIIFSPNPSSDKPFRAYYPAAQGSPGRSIAIILGIAFLLRRSQRMHYNRMKQSLFLALVEFHKATFLEFLMLLKKAIAIIANKQSLFSTKKIDAGFLASRPIIRHLLHESNLFWKLFLKKLFLFLFFLILPEIYPNSNLFGVLSKILESKLF